MKIGLLSNVNSGRNRGDGLAAFERPFAREGASLYRFDGVNSLHGLAEEIARDRIELLALNSGDGMVQGYWSALLGHDRNSWPVLAILPRGTTNMTAADIGLRSARTPNIERLLRLAGEDAIEPMIIERPAVRVDNLQAGPQCGAFFGAAGICDAVKICTQRMHQTGLRGDLAHAATVARMLFEMARGKGRLARIGGSGATLRMDGKQLTEARLLLIVASTLETLLFKSRPFWGSEPGELRTTFVDYPPKNLKTALARLLLRMDLSGLPETHYHSHNGQQLELTLNEPVLLDGEFYDPLPDQPMLLSTTAPFRLVHF